MWKYFTHHRTLRYLDVFSKLVNAYNHSYHRSIKRAPVSVTVQNEAKVSEILFGNKKLNCKNSKSSQAKFKVGYFVRTNKTKRISAMIKSQPPVAYKITDLDGESVRGTFYSQELQRVEKDNIYEIESILNHRKRKVGKKWVKEIKVHLKGYPSKFDSWIVESELV